MSQQPLPTVVALLPGPDRKRVPSIYQYGLTYRNTDPNAAGCVTQWQVCGGRMPYQIVLERDETGSLRLHCTCADAVFRGETAAAHFCKHVRGLLQLGTPTGPVPHMPDCLGA
jgi:hypothetical protein